MAEIEVLKPYNLIWSVNLDVCRYHEMKGRNRGRIFQAEFHAVDCTKQRARDFYRYGSAVDQ